MGKWRLDVNVEGVDGRDWVTVTVGDRQADTPRAELGATVQGMVEYQLDDTKPPVGMRI